MKISLFFAAALLALAPAHAQDAEKIWPTKPVKLVVPFAAGSTPDIIGRLIAGDIQSRHPGATVVVDNRPGAGGNTGTDAVAKSAPDGTTIGISLGGPLAINANLFSKLPYDPEKDIAPITMLTTLPSALVVPASLGIKTVAEFVALLRKDPGKITYGSIGAGSLSHLTMEAIGVQTGTKMVHVPYGGSPAAVTAVIRGDVQVACLPASAVTPQLDEGKLRILAVSTAKRSPYLPDVPTLKESGIDVESDAWNALIAPAGTPPDVIAQINSEVRKALENPSVKEKLKVQLIDPAPSSPEELRARITAEKKLWADVIKAADIRIN
ncbi:tripartite tricarboxylate transporter substrate binding protein [Bradyrhizobium sp. LHD-71]|uniref:Bug family tripartite tricarboxylate transporter substrate binding protein n=1 Tax=Bradyrhizobium sp. LHD-71 TaxID=3072141 RepID=UPI00280F0B4E|nr:tripartite tricarboxylate transporter substrate binding protein [Bradyrhizobium sp. LHD-71]MDQ8729853.1 tripartite tricarboxylate transporter substrate binding protein [Bradyrhizobium sp. LHD-71]